MYKSSFLTNSDAKVYIIAKRSNMNTKPEVPIIDVEAKCLIEDSSLYFIYGHSEA